MDLKEEQVLGANIHRHWYYRAKARLLAASAGKVGTVLDIGAGSGFFSRWLLRCGHAQKAVCVDPFYAAERDEEEAGKPILFRRSIDDCQADLLLMMDVMEHVDDDAGLLGQYLPLLRPGGRCFITAPAFRFLWSAHDDFLEHKRRYTLTQLERTVGGAGGRDIQGHYFYGAVFPAVAAFRLMRRGQPATGSDLRAHSGPVNAFLAGVCDAEQAVARWNRLAGVSVVVTCTGPTQTRTWAAPPLAA